MNTHLLAFGFGNLPLLGWLAAAAAPILIHLWMRHTYREMTWAAMQFLQAAIKRQARKLRLQQWLLLAIRTLIIVLAVLAACKPFWSDLGWLGGGTRVHRLLVFDTSLSMSAVEADESRFARAVALANELVDQSRPGESFSIVTLADPPRVVLAGPVADKSRVAAEIAKLETTYGSADLPATLALVQQAMDDADSRGQPFDRHEIICFTDLAAHTWSEVAGDGVATETVADSGASTDTESDSSDDPTLLDSLIVVDVGLEQIPNTSIASLEFEQKFPTTGRPLALVAQVRNYGDEPLEDLVVELQVDGVVAEEQRTTVPPRGTASVSFERTLTGEGWHDFVVKLPGDPLSGDNRRYLAAKLPKSVRVLCIEGRPGDAQYLADALDPLALGEGELLPTVVNAGRIRDTSLDEYRCVLLSNVPQLTESERKQLESYVRGGGGLGMFVGDAVDVDRYNSARSVAMLTPPSISLFTLLAQNVNTESPAKSLLPAVIQPAENQATLGIDPLEYKHPIAAVFRDREQAGLLSTPIFRYCPLKVDPADRNVEIALALADGQPLLVTGQFGRGRVAVCGTAATLESIDPATGQPWTLWPAWPSFLPVVKELVSYLDSEGGTANSLTIAESARGDLPANSTTATNLEVARPDGESDALVTGGGAGWEYDNLNLPGLYNVTANAGAKSVARLAVNSPESESDLTPLLPAEIPSGIQVVSDVDGGWGTGEFSSTAWFYRQLLYAVLVLMVVESLLANRWGRSAR